MNIPGLYQREKRHPSQMYHPMHHSTASYWTEAFGRNMKHDFNDDLFLNNIHLIPDPLKKNLADSLFNTETPTMPEKMYQQDQKTAGNGQEVPSEKPPKQNTKLGGIGNFFSGVMNVLTSVMFRSRAPNYYDCFDVDSQGQAWQHARTDVQDKNGQGGDCTSFNAPPNPNVCSEMNFDSRHAVTGCERKLNQVLHLLAPKQTSSPVWVRKRPKKVFVEPGSVEESFQDAFSPEDFCSLPDDSYIEYYSPLQYHTEELFETAAQKTKLNMAPVEEKTDIIKEVTKNDLELKKDVQCSENTHLEQKSAQLEQDSVQLEQQCVSSEKENKQLEKGNPQMENSPVQLEQQQKEAIKSDLNMGQQENKTLDVDQVDSCPTIKEQLVSSCEDKLSRLKALLQEKRMKCRKQDFTETPQTSADTSRTTPPKAIEKKTVDKHYKNPNRRCNKRSKAKLKCRIEDDLVFANEIIIDTPPSVENSPAQHSVNFGDYFDEVSGRFRTASTGSDDSFQIVFNDCHGRVRRASDCDSEDSFIIFEDSPESCYVSNDVFDSDSESEMSDSGCAVTCKLAHSLTRTVSNLADDSLYVSDDEVDFGMDTADDVVEKTGLLLDEKKKLLRKSQPSKKVHFSTDPPKVHVMRVWAFAARQARAGHWERYAVDRERFKRRIADADMALSWVLKPQHRCRVMFQRFRPWWNQLRRKELAEKKEREEEEKRQEEQRQEEEKQRQEEERLKGDTVKEVDNEQDEADSKNKTSQNSEVKCFNCVESGHRDSNDSEVKLDEDKLKGEIVQNAKNDDVGNKNNTSNANKREEKCLNCDESGRKESKDSNTICSGKQLDINSLVRDDNSKVENDSGQVKSDIGKVENDCGKVKGDRSKVASDFIIGSDALAKKLHDLENDSNIQIAQSSS